MKRYRHPRLRDVALTAVLDALADPWRLQIVRQLLGADDGAFTCSDFRMTVGKATRSHHFQVLREAGLVRMQADGNRCLTSLRREEIEARFPGLLGVVDHGPDGSRPRKVRPPRPATVPEPSGRRGRAAAPPAGRRAPAGANKPFPRTNGPSPGVRAKGGPRSSGRD